MRFQDETLSYGELDSRSNRLGAVLAEEGVGLGDPVVLHLPKSPDAIVGLLGIMKAGACCVPVDAGTPAPRLRAILDQCRARVAITSADTRDKLASQPLERVVDASEARGTGDPPPSQCPRTTSPTSSSPRARRGHPRASSSRT